MQKIKKGRGRPRLKAGDRRSRNFTFRSRPELRRRLQEASITSGRSISQEIEWRLETSFRDTDILLAIAEGARNVCAEYRKEMASKRRNKLQSVPLPTEDNPT